MRPFFLPWNAGRATIRDRPCPTPMMPRFLPLLAILLNAVLGAVETRPNIVVVIGEDMGPDMGVYGCKDAITPNMDRLAKEGALFTRAFTHTGVCAPSRSGMVTGQYPLKYGAQNMRSRIAMQRLGAELIGEEEVAYFGEPPRMNVVFRITAS